MPQSIRFLMAMVVIITAGVASDVSAHSPLDKSQGGDLAQLVERANLVFVGRVARISYRNAEPADEKSEGAVPYTIVTYEIEQVLRGEAPGKEISFRVVGGPDGTGRFLTVSGVPVVQEGDQDVLFVENPDDPSCPFVFCENGRYRILAEQLFDTYGSPVRSLRNGHILARGVPPKELRTLLYPTPTFDELMKNPEVARQLEAEGMTADEARARYELEAPRVTLVDLPWFEQEKGEDEPDTLMKSAEGVEEDTRVSLLEFVAATTLVAKDSKRAPLAVKGIDPEATFTAARFAVEPPPAATEPALQPRTSAADAEEYKALMRNGHDPVMPRRRKP